MDQHQSLDQGLGTPALNSLFVYLASPWINQQRVYDVLCPTLVDYWDWLQLPANNRLVKMAECSLSGFLVLYTYLHLWSVCLPSSFYNLPQSGEVSKNELFPFLSSV